MNSFWSKFKKPIFALAPMSGVTDHPFRQMVASLAKPDVIFTEFVHVRSLCHPEGRKKMIRRLDFTDSQRPIVAQLWGTEPEYFFEATKLVKKMGFDGVDINMGCPDRDVLASGGGSALIENKPLALQIIKSTQKAAGKLPVSLKTRVGFRTVDEEWLGLLLDQGLAALTVHVRTAKQRYKPPVRWEVMDWLVKKRQAVGGKTLLLGNGDIKTLDQARGRVEEFGLDGAMMARAILSDPWLFEKEKKTHTKKEAAQKLMEHVQVYEGWSGAVDFNSLKKFFKMYLVGFPHAAQLRAKLMTTSSGLEVKKILKKAKLI